MAVIIATNLLFAPFNTGLDVVLPLWVTKDLGLTAGQWAYLRSLRFTGSLAGALVLGALSDRLGAKRIGALSMLAAAVGVALLGLGFTGWLWVIMPALGALLSTAFVNMNTLTQWVSARRQGVANSIYRSIGAGAAVVAPIAVTTLAACLGGYPPVLALLAMVLCLSAAALLFYPIAAEPPLGAWRDELAALWRNYVKALRQRELMAFVHVYQIWSAVVAVNGAFMAIRLTRELGRSDAWFGLVASVGGTVAFAATAATGFFLDRISLRRFCGVSAILVSAATLAAGLTDSAWLSAVVLLLAAALATCSIAPVSMWISRAAGEAGQTAAFSVQKVIAALYVAIGMAVWGLLERWFSVRGLFLLAGLLGLPFALAILRLTEPGTAAAAGANTQGESR